MPSRLHNFKGTLQTVLVLLCEGEEIIFLVKMVSVCCGLTNMCPSPSVVYSILRMENLQTDYIISNCGL